MAEANEEQSVNILEIINSKPAAMMPTIPQVAARFKKLFSIVHFGSLSPEAMRRAEIFYEVERFHFMKLINENPKLAACTKKSLYGCWLDASVNGLSFDPSFKHQAIVPYNVNVGTKQKEVWEKRATLQVQGPGELVLRVKQKQIKHADNPVLVYESDKFSHGTRNGKRFVDHETIYPRTGDKIIATYIWITRNDGTMDVKVIEQQDMDRFRASSKEPNSPAWTKSIGGMWIAKCLKHSFKPYPKLRTGSFTKLESEVIDEPDDAGDTSFMIDYGDDVVDTVKPVVQDKKTETQEVTEPVDENDFGNTADNSSTVRVEDEDF